MTTAQDKLDDLLRHGRCIIGEPVGVHYSPKVDEQQAAKGDLWRVELSAGCNLAGLGDFARDGVVIFEKREGQAWEPQSFLAKLLATYASELTDQKDPEAFEGAQKSLAK
ncbi:hypothetical protein [Bradyrhizobium sp. DASA03120]|uniref:hypothetical protein n=1 Tax=Bradyrhizobium sp. SMVTL-02 TaxID=3395917 RepID=UPI003F6F9B58